MMNKKLSGSQIFFTLLGVAVVVVSAFLLIRALGSQGPMESAPNVVLPAQNPYSFSSSSPLAITQATEHVSGMGSLVDYTGTLPAVGSCQEVRVQTPTYAKNPVRFAIIVNTSATSSCADPNAPQTFTASFGADKTGNAPILSAVFVNGNKVMYAVNGN
jgi:hypothetical protein